MMIFRNGCRFFSVIVLLIALGIGHSADAALDTPTPQVLVESRFVNVSGEALLNLGVAWNSIDGSYSSTGAQAPAQVSSSGTFGVAGVGGNVWFNTRSDQIPFMGPLTVGSVKIGAGATVNGYFGADHVRDILRIIRHHPAQNSIDIIGSYGIDWSVDFTAKVKIPILVSSDQTAPPANTADDGKKRMPVLVNLELFAGPSIVGTQTELRSDQSFFGGTNDRVRKRNVEVVPLVGAGLSRRITTVKVPLLGDLPVLGRLFYGARFMPGTDVTNPSNLGFSEKIRTSHHTQHEARAELVLIITPRIVRQE